MIVRIRYRLRRLGFRFDGLSVFLICQQYNVELKDLDKIGKEYMPSWVWCAYRSYQFYYKKKARISYDKMKRIISRMRKRDWDKIIAVISSEGEKGKKKMTSHGTISSSQDGGQV